MNPQCECNFQFFKNFPANWQENQMRVKIFHVLIYSKYLLKNNTLGGLQSVCINCLPRWGLQCSLSPRMSLTNHKTLKNLWQFLGDLCQPSEHWNSLEGYRRYSEVLENKSFACNTGTGCWRHVTAIFDMTHGQLLMYSSVDLCSLAKHDS